MDKASIDYSVDLDIAKEHGLSEEEYKQILSILKRNPTYVEIGIFSVMWSEHCSYKSSIKMLKTFPRDGDVMLVGAGEENAGIVDIGNDMALTFKIESHNHPSAVEPYQGAATGVGGIMRDIFTMGARPIASLNSLRFGSLEIARNRFLLDHAVQGIADYGNCLGIPTVGGEVVIEDSYTGNCLVNAMSVGVGHKDHIISAIAKGVGNPVYIVGSKTGKDGIHGATFASVELTEETESKKSNVQVGDPFTEKLLLEASMELSRKDWLVGMQDMGAAGITCSCTEMSAKGGVGLSINLDKVPLREKNMNPYEIMLSESQERMLVVIDKGYDDSLIEIFKKWDLDCECIGAVTDTGNLEVYSKGEKVADLPCDPLVLGGGAPQYDMPSIEPAYLKSSIVKESDFDDSKNYREILLNLLACPNITSKRFVFEQYDSTVRTNTVQGPGGSAAVVRLKGTNKAISISTDCNGRFVYLNPYEGGKRAVAESSRNVVCTGAKPIAITNCLNFGNPQDPEVYWQFKRAVEGIGEACKVLNTPVTGGNVSFYNETNDSSIYPTPVIGMVGLMEDVSHSTTIGYKEPGDIILCIGNLTGEFGGSEYLKVIHGEVKGPISTLDLAQEVAVQEVCLESIQSGYIKSAHDISDGGLAINIAESILSSVGSIGAEIHITSKIRTDLLLFGESQSVIIVTVSKENLHNVVLKAKANDVFTQCIGSVNNSGRLTFNDVLSVERSEMSPAYFETLGKIIDY
ncbi:MAG: phosphoribosylformylglycinamidine synthase II [bacterium TMED198]|nr:MAG: phosphoribosylformylglycinamidine synthase II [bacterium TMED198]